MRIALLVKNKKLNFYIQNKRKILLENTELSGKSIAQIFAKEKVNVVIINHLGEGAFRNLKNHGIKAYYCENKNIPVEKVLELFSENKLVEINKDNFSIVPQHHGHKHH